MNQQLDNFENHSPSRHYIRRSVQSVESSDATRDDGGYDEVNISFSWKIVTAVLFISCLMALLGFFHWYFNRKYSRQTEIAMEVYTEARLESLMAMNREDDDEAITRRLKLIRQFAKNKMTVKEEDIVIEQEVLLDGNECCREISKGDAAAAAEATGLPSGGKGVTFALSSPLQDQDDEESKLGGGESLIKLPDKRLVRNCCSICLASYGKGDTLVWSANQRCPHVFHFDCILRWLSQKDASLCPMCRQVYVGLPKDQEKRLSGGVWGFRFLNNANSNDRRPSFVTTEATMTEFGDDDDENNISRSRSCSECSHATHVPPNRRRSCPNLNLEVIEGDDESEDGNIALKRRNSI